MELSKTQLRQLVLNQRKALPTDKAQELSAQIAHRVWRDCAWIQGSTAVALYIPILGEVDTRLLCNWFWSHNQKVCMPRVSDQTSLLEFAEVGLDESCMLNARLGTLEPELKRPAVEIDKIDLVFVPGVVFDLCGHRIGLGKGYYDQVLPAMQARRVALAYDFQVKPSIPFDPWDCAVDLIVTEARIIACHDVT